MSRNVQAIGMCILGTALLLLPLACGGGGGGSGPSPATVYVSILSPSMDMEVLPGAEVPIRYTDDDLAGASDATTTIYAIPADTPTEQLKILDKAPHRNGTVQTFLWKTTGVAAGPYRIEARCSDRNSEVIATSAGTIRVSDLPLTITNPTGDATVSRGGFTRIYFRAGFTTTPALIGFFADRDGFLESDIDRYPIASDVPDQNGSEQSVIWDTVGMSTGIYRLFATVARPGLADSTVLLTTRAYITETGASARIGTADTDQGLAVAAWPDGNTVLGGVWNGRSPAGVGFLAGFGTGFSQKWIKEASDATTSNFARLLPWADGSFLAVGSMSTPGTLGKGETNQASLGAGVFWAKYNSDGTLAWATAPPIPAGAQDSDLSPMPDGGFIVTGSYTGMVTFGNGVILQNLTSAGASDVFVARYDPAGFMLWAKSCGGTGGDASFGIEVLPDGSSLVLGAFTGQATFGPGEAKQTNLTAARPIDTFVARFDPQGSLVRATGGLVPPSGNPIGSELRFAAHRDGAFVIVGTISANDRISIGTPEETAITTTGQTMFVARFLADSKLDWAKTATDGAAFTIPSDLAAFDNGSFVIVGTVGSNVLFGPGERSATTLSAGAFRARYRVASQLDWAANLETNGIVPPVLAGFADGSFAIGGDFKGSVTFGAGTARQKTLTTPTTSAWDRDAYIARYNADGTY